jgi:diguanylate cyclase (GGDEF)-like protein
MKTGGETASLTNGATRQIASRLQKLRFLRGNWHLLVAWPTAAIMLALAGWGVMLRQLDRDRQELEDATLKQAATLARSYADHLTRTIESIDQILLHVRYEWKLTNGSLRLESAKEQGLFPSTAHFNVGITDRNGVLLTNTIERANPPPAVDRPYFFMQRSARGDYLYSGEPARGRASNRSVIHFSRRITAEDGSFAGVVRASISPEYLTADYDTVALGKNGLIGILGVDGVIRVIRTGDKVYRWNERAMTAVPRFSMEGGSILLKGNDWFADKRSRYVGWEKVEGHPLIALAGLDEADALLPYRQERAAAIRQAVQNTFALAVFTLIAMALSMRLAWRKYQMEQTQATYRMATEGGKEGFYIGRPIRDVHGTILDFIVVDCNHRGAEFLHLRREDLIGQKYSAVYQASTNEHRLQIFRQAMEDGIYEGELQEPDDSPLITRWVHVKAMRSGDDLALTLRDISDTKKHVAELERLSNEDVLTGLPNRHWVQCYLPKAIDHAAVNNAMLALLFIDLDGFKAVNDTAGHEAGDDVLRNAARRLKLAVRPHDWVARLGGDEFVVILERIAHKEDAAHIAERIQHAFRGSFRISQGTHSIGTSIGISIFPTDATDSQTLLRNADIAMYSVKTSGKRNYRFFDEKYYDLLRTRLEKEAELRHAIKHDQFVMYYQPRVDISSGVTSSMEALVRWAHPTKGLISPLDFIPMAEETDLILSLGELIINKVCAQLAYWAQRDSELLPVSINVSSRQFNGTDVARILSEAIARHQIDPRLIEIELTESLMMGDSRDVADALAAIQKMGIKLLIDDFGTGYSSLSQLQRMDFDVLKVDRAFTAELEKTEEGNVFFKAIITMAHALGMRVVAEGVENVEQIRILKSLKCDEIQGFYISRPMPPSDTQPILPKWFLPSTT